MSDEHSIKIKQTNEDLRKLQQNMSGVYLDVADCYEERMRRIKNMLEAGILDENESEYYSNQVEKIQRNINDLDFLKSEDSSKINKIIVENEEELEKMKKNDEDDDSLKE